MQKSVHSKVYLTVVFVKKSKKTKNIKHKHKSKQENIYISLEIMIFCSVTEILLLQWIQRHFTSESYIMEWDLFSACRESPLLIWFFFSQPMGIISSGQSTKDLKLNLTSKQSFVKFAVCCCCFFFLFFFSFSYIIKQFCFNEGLCHCHGDIYHFAWSHSFSMQFTNYGTTKLWMMFSNARKP